MTTPTFTGQLEAIYIAPAGGALPAEQDQVEALPGLGLAGDRYALRAGTWMKPGMFSEITLIEAEALEAIAAESGLLVSGAESRRNLLTRGVPLNHLVGREFLIGTGTAAVRLRGERLCEPCGYLDKKTMAGVKDALMHRGGLRASIISGGLLRLGDSIQPA